MGYKTRPIIRLDFEELGDNDGTPFFVEIKNPKMLTYNERMEPAITSKDAIDANGKMVMTKENFAMLAKYALSFVTSWNLLSKIDETPIEFDDPDVLEKIPGDIVMAIQEKITPKKEDPEIKNS
jgi:hypothetical protein